MISFDFDGTLSRNDVQAFAFELISNGYKICVLTSRLSDESAPSDTWNNDLWEVCNRIGITDVYFTNGSWKAHYVKNLGITIHLDDDNLELNRINSTGVKGISVWGNNSWKRKVLNDNTQPISKEI